ncbi:1,2-phenylacetyl-CoA epoxidase subunit PaaE [Piscinibacter koreensis]|uniref:Phenylacetate-CoA oxygenase/reductase subunit PaaK n=1 Tax=Piscinibacter koreensis TaxID=2742824 RepID=A0A7Y6NKU0_9BURK|nr:1,2-phenylacetyl-CoA epoxidase subunit PaaE [Schlegelella koreensis]NUZ04965.1 phenylacetate-CoA oxygenase/reductase subunit PaaK [Schlegelella koreensis]
MALHFHPLRIKRIVPDADDALLVSFDVPEALRDEFRFTHGQHLTLLGHIGGVEQRRSYSICSGVDDGELRVGVRKVEGGVFSTWLHEHLRVGDTVQVMTPEGRFFVPLETGAARHYLGIAGGSGITPILSIVKTVLAREPRSRFTLIYGNRRQRSAMFKEELEDLKNRYLSRLVLHWVFSREQTDLPLYNGRLDRAKIAEFLGSVVDVGSVDHAFVCGPHGINDAAEAALLEAGLSPTHVHIERFGIPAESQALLAPVADARDAAEASIVIVRDGIRRELAFHREDGNILDAAAAAGIDVPFSCRSGVCCTCRAKLVEGEVRMDRNFALERHEVEAGFVLACQAHPLSERVVLSFDER